MIVLIIVYIYSAFDGEGITVPTILTEHGYTLASTLRFFVVSGSVAFVFYIISALTAEKTQRKYLAALAAFLTGIFMALLGTLYNPINLRFSSIIILPGRIHISLYIPAYSRALPYRS